jgi:hypothetical protein
MVLLYFLITITYLDRITISLVGVRIKSAFHLNNTEFGWALGAFAPLIVIPVAVAYGWRAPFFVNAFIGRLWVWYVIAGY